MPEQRILRVGSRGRDVRAVQRALRKAGFRPKERKISNAFGAKMKEEVKNFQRASGLRPVDGEMGKDTFKALRPHFDAYGRWLLKKAAQARKKANTPRQKIVAAAHLGYQNRASIHYSQDTSVGQSVAGRDRRRMDGVRNKLRPPKHPSFEDCSSFVTWCYWVADATDPNGVGFNGTGNTATQIAHGHEVSAPRPGDLVFYGHSHGNINHVTLYVGNGRVISHGQESGPSLYSIDYHRPGGGRQQLRSYP
jgi:peptidoglycan hydrolase-like protein with peptidoglycan-binding domain